MTWKSLTNLQFKMERMSRPGIKRIPNPCHERKADQRAYSPYENCAHKEADEAT